MEENKNLENNQEAVENNEGGSNEATENKFSTKLEDGTYKVNLKPEGDVQKQEGDEHREDGNEKGDQTGNKEKGEGLQNENEEEVIVEITEDQEKAEQREASNSDSKDNKETVKSVTEEAAESNIELPENIQKVVEFMNETGGSLEDYVRLNADYSNADEKVLLKEYLKQTKPHLDDGEINFLIEDKYTFDEDFDDEKEVKRKKLAYKEAVEEAKTHLEGLKSKYYDEVKLGSKLLPEQKKAIEFYNEYSKEQKFSEEQAKMKRDHFISESEKLFSEDFKGFDFKAGDKKFRYNVKDASKVKESQSDIVSAFSDFLGEDGKLKDAKGYHRALFAAKNADSLATHFYEQGKAEAIKDMMAESKNINMDPRKVSNGVIETGKAKVKAVSGDDVPKTKLKLKNY